VIDANEPTSCPFAGGAAHAWCKTDYVSAAAGALASDIGSSSIGARTKAEDQRKEIQWIELYVGGLSYSTTSETLREYFAQCGTVESAAVITDKFSGQSRGFGFVEMAHRRGGAARDPPS